MTAPAHFGDRLAARVAATGSVLCVGIDPRPPFPEECVRGLAASRSGRARALERYSIGLVDAVADTVAAVKPQVAFFEALGGYGLTALDAVCAAARERGLLVVADAKRGDIGSTAVAYADAWLRPRDVGEPAVADVLTVNPYLGADAVEPFLVAADDEGAGLYVLTRTSNPGAADLQERELVDGGTLWERVAGLVGEWGQPRVGTSGLSSIGAVVGLTAPGAIARVRTLAPAAPLLLPGFGAQGGDPAAARPAFAAHPAGGLLVAARSVIEAWRAEPGGWRDAVVRSAREHDEAARRVGDAGSG